MISGASGGKGHTRSESHSPSVPPTPTGTNSHNWKQQQQPPPATPASRDASPSLNPITASNTPSLFSVATATPRFPQAVPLTVYRKTAPSQMLSEADQLAALKNVEIAKVAAEATKEMPAAVAARKVEMKVEPERNKAVFGANSPSTANRALLKPRGETTTPQLRSWHQPDDKESMLMDEPDEPSPAQDEKMARAARKRLGLVGFASSNAHHSSQAALELDPSTQSVLASKTEMEVERMYAQIVSPSSHLPATTHSSSVSTPQTPGRRVYSHQGLPISLIRTGSINYSLASAMRQREAEKRAALRSAGSQQGKNSSSKQNSARLRTRQLGLDAILADDDDEDDDDEFDGGRGSALVSRRQLPPVGTVPATPVLSTSTLLNRLPPAAAQRPARRRPAQKKTTPAQDDPAQLGQLTHPPLHSANGIDSLRGVKELTSEYVVFGARSPGLRSNAAASVSRGRRQANGMAPSNRLALDHWQPSADGHVSPVPSHPMEEKSNLPFLSESNVFASVNQVYPAPQHRGAPSATANNDMFTVIRRRSYRDPTPVDSSPFSTSSSPLTGNSRPSSNYLLSPSPITPSQHTGAAGGYRPSVSSLSSQHPTSTIPRATNPALLLSQQHQLAFLIQEQTAHRNQLLETQHKEELQAERLKTENRNELFHFEDDESAPSISRAIAAAASAATDEESQGYRHPQQLQSVWQLAFSLKFAVNIIPGTDAWIEVAKYDSLKKNFVRVLTSSPQAAVAGAEVKFSEPVCVPPDTLSVRIAVYASDPTNAESSSSSTSLVPRLVDTFIHPLHEATDGASQLFTFVLCPDPTQAYPRADDFTVLHVDINQASVPAQQLQAKSTAEVSHDPNTSLAPLTALPPLNSVRHKPEAAADGDDGILRFGASSAAQPAPQFIPLVSAPVTNGVSRANSAQIKLMPSSNIGIWTSPHSSLAYSQLLKAVPKPILKAAHSVLPGVNVDSDSEDETMYDMRSPVQIPHPPPVDLSEEERNRRLAMFEFELQDDKVLEA